MRSSEFRRDGALTVEFRRPREGPPSYLVWEPGKSYICMDRSSLLKAVKWPKYTATGIKLREWLDEVEQAPPEQPKEQTSESGFGPEQ